MSRIEETVPPALGHERLDRTVAVVTGVTRAEAAGLVDDGATLVNGVVITHRSHRVSEGDVITVELPVRTPGLDLAPDPTVEFDVVYADDSVIVVNKPAGLVVHPGSGHQSGTLVHGLLARFPDLRALAVGGQAVRPGIVHRLDKGTSGLLMVARTRVAETSLIEQLRARTVSRRYHALAHGRFGALNGVIDAPVGRSEHDPTKMTVSASGREAITHYAVERSFDRPEPLSYAECWLETGRTHQIRVHLAAIGHPVVGDQRYGGHAIGGIARPFLHAFSLSFDDPATGERRSFSAALPADLAELLARCSVDGARTS